MFKKFGMLLLAACFVLSAQVKAEAEPTDKIGVYVAPKFVYGIGTFKGKAIDSATGTLASKNATENAFGGAFAIGYDFSKRLDVPVRVELEYAATSRMDKTANSSWFEEGYGEGWEDYKTKIDVQSLFLNAYYDFKNSTAFTPYIGAGVGLAFVGTKMNVNGYEDSIDVSNDSWDYTVGKKTRTNFAWNVGLGCSYALNETVSIDLGYRYADFGKAKTKTLTGYDDVDNVNFTIHGKAKRVAMHQFMLGARFTF